MLKNQSDKKRMFGCDIGTNDVVFSCTVSLMSSSSADTNILGAWVSGTASHAAMATSPSAASMLRNTSEKDMGNGNGDVHKVMM
jgi:hypothetical protein